MCPGTPRPKLQALEDAALAVVSRGQFGQSWSIQQGVSELLGIAEVFRTDLPGLLRLFKEEGPHWLAIGRKLRLIQWMMPRNTEAGLAWPEEYVEWRERYSSSDGS